MEVKVVVINKGGVGKTFALPSNVTVIGRRSSCDLQVPLSAVSRKHCQISQVDGQLKLRDLGSRNGTYLNGERVSEAMIKGGDSVRIGPLTFVFQIDGKPETVAVQDGGKPSDSEEVTEQEELLPEDLDGIGDLDDVDFTEEVR